MLSPEPWSQLCTSKPWMDQNSSSLLAAAKRWRAYARVHPVSSSLSEASSASSSTPQSDNLSLSYPCHFLLLGNRGKRCLHLVGAGELKRRFAVLREKGRRQVVRGVDVSTSSSISSVHPVWTASWTHVCRRACASIQPKVYQFLQCLTPVSELFRNLASGVSSHQGTDPRLALQCLSRGFYVPGIHTYVNTYTHVCMCVYICICIHACIYIHTQRHTYISRITYIHRKHWCTYMCIRLCMYVFLFVT